MAGALSAVQAYGRARQRAGPRSAPDDFAKVDSVQWLQGNTGVINAGALEESNVDLTAELVNMITAQRDYQANAQTIKTQDQAMQTLVNLR